MLSKITNLKQDTDNEDKFDEYNKNKNDLKIYIYMLSIIIQCYPLQKVWKLAAKAFGIYTVKNLQNFFMAWKKEMQYVGLLKSC